MYKAILSYDGTHYFGWQKTRSGPSIQETLGKAIFQMTHENVLPEAASRTDRGVHAEGQVVQFSLAKSLEPARLLRGLNALLPEDVRVRELTFRDFHPTLDAIGKEYHYRLCVKQVQEPIHRLYSWHFRHELDLEKMKQETVYLLGEHDFSAFTNERGKDPICRLDSIEIAPLSDDRLQIIIRGNRFLYKMVRNLVGTLIHVGVRKIASVLPILRSCNRTLAGITAPSHGLYLHQVFYPWDARKLGPSEGLV